MKHVAILYSEYSPTVDAIKYQLKNEQVDCKNSIDTNDNYDLVILSNYINEYPGNALACHHSLFPAFKGNEPEKEAIIEGVKITGITFYFTKPEKIIAQYPLVITNDMHFDDLKQRLNYLEQVLFPIVAEQVLYNKIFECQTFINKISSGCKGGCGQCNH